MKVETSDFVIQAADFDGEWLQDIKPIKRKGRKKTNQKEFNYLPLVCAFDIETTTLLDKRQAFMYHWQFQVDRYCTVTGRTWEEFTGFIGELIGNLGDNTLVCYVFNLSYEWQFMSDPEIYDFVTDEIFALDERSILKCRIGNQIEFRCAYRLFNMGLKKVTEDYDVKHKKLDGDEYDYTKIRYPWTPLSDMELQYCYNDVRGLVEAVYAIMDAYHDDLRSIPMTSTGYPRRDCKKVLYPLRQYIQAITPPFRVYQVMRKAFRGGDTHGSRHWVGSILNDIYSYDISSDYPSQFANRRFPMSAWYQVSPGNLNDNYMIDLIKRRQKAVLCVIDIYFLKLKQEDWPAPYLSVDKCWDIEWDDKPEACKDNGRILHCKKLTCAVTDLDLRIILKEYDGHIEWREAYYAKYGNLPRRFVETVNEYYKSKTELKGVEGLEIEYLESKKKVNALYGMGVTDPVRVPLIYDNDERCLHFKGNDGRLDEEDINIEEIYEDYRKKAWMPYCWGVWCTAWARLTLHEQMWAISEDGEGFGMYDLVYWDTDSVKHFEAHEKSYEKTNRTIRALSRINGAKAKDRKGKIHYMGVFEQEKTYSRFEHWGAKKYAYEYPDEKECHITIAGVNKRLGAEELTMKGGLEAMEEGLVFTLGGGTESTYNDFVAPENQWIHVDGHDLHITKNLAIAPSSYTLKDSAELLDWGEMFKQTDLWNKMLDDNRIYNYTSNRSTRS